MLSAIVLLNTERDKTNKVAEPWPIPTASEKFIPSRDVMISPLSCGRARPINWRGRHRTYWSFPGITDSETLIAAASIASRFGADVFHRHGKSLTGY